jgi:hypothetical protein
MNPTYYNRSIRLRRGYGATSPPLATGRCGDASSLGLVFEDEDEDENGTGLF